MIDLRRGNGDHPPSSQSGPLGEVEPGSHGLEQLVEAAQPLGQVTSHQHRHRGHEGNFTHDVVLLKIDLSFVEPGVGIAEYVRGATDRLQLVPGPRKEQLGSTERGFVSVQFPDQGRQRIGPRPGIGVQDPEVVDLCPGDGDGLFQGRHPAHTTRQITTRGTDDDHLVNAFIDLPVHGGQGRLEVGAFHQGDDHLDAGRVRWHQGR